MWKMKAWCFCWPLRIAAVVGLAFSVWLAIFMGIICTYYVISLLLGNTEYETTLELIRIGSAATVVAILIVAATCLLYGLLKEKSAFILVWLIIALFCIPFNAYVNIYMKSYKPIGSVIFVAVYTIVIAAFLIYVWIGVFFYYLELRHKIHDDEETGTNVEEN